MTPGPEKVIRRPRATALMVAATLLLFSFVLTQTAQWTRQSGLAQLNASKGNQLALYMSFLQGQLQKYEYLPELLASDARLVHLLQNPGNRERTDALNRYLELVNEIADASDIYLMDAEGLTIAASNWASERPFVGRNFGYRPYFREALEGRLGRYFALGITSNKRGYYFAYPVRHDRKIIGAVVVKINMAKIEGGWRRAGDHFIVTDSDGVIFITTEKDWRFKTLTPLGPDVERRIRESRRYVHEKLAPLEVEDVRPLGGGSRVIDILSPGAERYLLTGMDMPEAGWRVHILSRLNTVEDQVLVALFVAAVLLTVALLMILFFVQRRRRFRERTRYERRAKRLLESRVKERTKDLTATNERLTREIDEHRRTEEALRLTQDELIQATKMATLGQMSTGISHELNQPLAAIRSYADNACALLRHERTKDAVWNLTQIGELTDRMAQISSQLKVFARKTSGQLVNVSLPAVIENSLKILNPRIRETETTISVQLPEPEIFVSADMVHLEQVLVNLVGNALQSVEFEERRLIEISASSLNDRILITIKDSGAGIDESHLNRIFDPFFTTKEEGQGLGLGLSISYRIVEGMGGRLSARNHADGGAVFTLEMPAGKMLDEPVEKENQ